FELARLAEEAGFTPGVVNVVTGAREAGEALVEHPGVAKISFTGSEAGGKAIAARCGARLASCTLELGGRARTSCSTTRTWTSRKRACSPASSPRRERRASPDR